MFFILHLYYVSILYDVIYIIYDLKYKHIIYLKYIFMVFRLLFKVSWKATRFPKKDEIGPDLCC